MTIQIQNAAYSSDLIFNGYDLEFLYNRTAGSGLIALNTAAVPAANSSSPVGFIAGPA